MKIRINHSIWYEHVLRRFKNIIVKRGKSISILVQDHKNFTRK